MKKIWNVAPMAVWSLSTNDTDGQPNMNICTYVTAISMKPKEYIVGLYYDTKTYQNVVATQRGLLQLLSAEQSGVVRRLGKQSSLSKPNKMKNFLSKEDHAIHGEFVYLLESLGFVELEFYRIETDSTADHAIGYARVVGSKTLHEGESLTTDILQAEKIIL